MPQNNKHFAELAPRGRHRCGMKKLRHCRPLYTSKLLVASTCWITVGRQSISSDCGESLECSAGVDQNVIVLAIWRFDDN